MKKTIEIKGIEELRIRCEDPSLVGEPLKELLEEATTMGRREAETAIDGGTGIAVRSIAGEVKDTSARVYTAIPRVRARSIEEGRSPGADPDAILAQMIRWKEAVGHPESGRQVAREISRAGTRGKRFMAAARKKIEEAMPRLVQDLVRKVEERWAASR